MGFLVALYCVLPVVNFAFATQETQKAPVVSAWYAGWHANAGFPLEKVSWDKYTQMTYSFAETTESVHTLSLTGSNPQLLPEFVSTAQKNNVKASVSIGGWTGSRFYSSNVGSAANRTAFVKTVTTFAKKYQLDGIDFDWEYPNNQGIGCNVIKPADTANFLAFLQELRKDPIGANLTLSAATSISPFMAKNGSPSKDVSAFSSVLDYVAIMNYDIWGPWSATVGPNAPLNDSCASDENQQGSAVSAVKAWHAAGFPMNQLVLGVASYGHSFRVNNSAAFAPGSSTTLIPYPGFNVADQPDGDKWDDAAGPDVCGVMQPVGGNWDFWGLIDGGFLDAKGLPMPGVAYRFDDCSQTAYVYNKTTEVMVSYDDAKAFTAKGDFIKAQGLGGLAMWEAGGDSNDILLDSIRCAMGLAPTY